MVQVTDRASKWAYCACAWFCDRTRLLIAQRNPMIHIRRLFSPALVLAALPLVACGGEDGVSAPEGPHYTYVVAEASVPVNNMQAREYGLDLNGDKAADNQLGMVL